MLLHFLAFVSRWLSFSAESQTTFAESEAALRTQGDPASPLPSCIPCFLPSIPASCLPSSFLLSLSSFFPPSFPPSLPFPLLWFLTEVLPAALLILKHPNLSHNQESSSSLLLPARSLDHLPQNHVGSLLKTQTPHPKQCKPNSSSKPSFQCLNEAVLPSPGLIFTEADSPTLFRAFSYTLVISWRA